MRRKFYYGKNYYEKEVLVSKTYFYYEKEASWEGSSVMEKLCSYKEASVWKRIFLCEGSSIMFFPQQPERLGVLPIKLRGGLGQPPETLHQVPRGSEGMEPVPK